MSQLILINGKFRTLDPKRPTASAVAIKDGVFEAVGSDDEIMKLREPTAEVIDLKKHTPFPG